MLAGSASAPGRARKTSVNVGERARRSFVDDILATLPLHGDGVFIFPCMVACIYAIGVFVLGVVRILKLAFGLFCVYVCTLLCQVICLALSESGMKQLEARAIGAGRAAAGVYVGYNMIIRENMTWAESVVAGLANVINVIGPLVACVVTALCTIFVIVAAVVIACFWLRSRHTVPVAAPRMTHPAELDDIKATVSHAKAELAARGEEVAALRVALSEMVESLRTGRTVASKSTIAAESQATAEASPAAAVPALTGAAAASLAAPASLTTMKAAPAAVVAAPSPTLSAAADSPSVVPSPQMAALAAPVAEPHPAVAILPMKASSAMAGEAEAAAPPTAASPAKTVPPVSPSPAPATPGASPVAAVDAVSPSAAPPALAAVAATPSDAPASPGAASPATAAAAASPAVTLPARLAVAATPSVPPASHTMALPAAAAVAAGQPGVAVPPPPAAPAAPAAASVSELESLTKSIARLCHMLSHTAKLGRPRKNACKRAPKGTAGGGVSKPPGSDDRRERAKKPAGKACRNVTEAGRQKRPRSPTGSAPGVGPGAKAARAAGPAAPKSGKGPAVGRDSGARPAKTRKPAPKASGLPQNALGAGRSAHSGQRASRSASSGTPYTSQSLRFAAEAILGPALGDVCAECDLADSVIGTQAHARSRVGQRG